MKNRSREIDILEIEEEYAPSEDIMTDEDEKSIRAKEIVFGRLDETERRIILLYAEEQSMRKVAKHLGVSTATAYNYIKAIQNKIKELMLV